MKSRGITQQVSPVYYAPTAGRRFLTKKSAINKEARAIIKKHFPDERGCRGEIDGCGPYGCGDPGWSLEVDQPERFNRYYTMLCAAIANRFANDGID